MDPPHNRPVVVLDCMVFLQAIANEGSSSARVLDFVNEGRIKLYVSEETLFELRGVLERPEVRRALPAISDLRLESFFRRLNKKAIMMKRVPRAFEFQRDPSDQPYLNLAIEAHADFLISRDRDLLDLMINHDSESKQFRQRFRFLRIVQPEDLLREVEDPKSRR